MTRKRVAVLISGRGSNMTALIEAAEAPDYPAQIVLVLSNEPGAAGLGHAQQAGIATVVVDHKPFGKDREAFERALDDTLHAHRIDLVCLAGFMRLLTPWFVTRWSGRMLNIHPALLAAVQRPAHSPPRARGRRAAARRHRSLRGAGNGFRTDRAAGFGSGARRRHRSNAGRARARGRAPDLSTSVAPRCRRPRHACGRDCGDTRVMRAKSFPPPEK